MSVAFSVLLATHNGEDVLARSLAGYVRATHPGVPWKIIIVDNASTDASATVVRSFASRLPIELIKEQRRGKSCAINRAISAAAGEFVIITDDDSIPAPSFLVEWVNVLEVQREYELFGGRIEPLFEISPPKWLRDSRLHFDLMFAERDCPEGPINPEGIFGCNMAVRTSAFHRGLRFDENIGPEAGNGDYGMGDETVFCRSVASSGGKCWFARKPRVQHIVRAWQLTQASLAKRAYRHGRGIVLWMDPAMQGSVRAIARARSLSWLDRQIFSRLPRLAALSRDRARSFANMVDFQIARGIEDMRAELLDGKRNSQIVSPLSAPLPEPKN